MKTRKPSRKLTTREPVRSTGLVVPPSVDMRSPLAKARDEWLASADGVTCGDPTTLGASPLTRQYLENRLVKAFLAGANWMERQK